MHKPSFKVLMILTLAVTVGLVGFVVWRLGLPTAARRISYQDADNPLAMPESGDVDHRFQFLSAWQMAQIPRAHRFEPPLGSEHGALVYNAQKFWDMNDKRGGRHLGDDLNGIGGMNSDLGDPVFAVADGLVLFAGESSAGWGKVVIIAHATPDGRILQSMMAHLDRIDVSSGTLVPRGGRIGTVGTANGCYPAHLHFEMRNSEGVDIGGGYSSVPLNRLDPLATLTALRRAAPDDLAPSPLAHVLAAGGTATDLLDDKRAEQGGGR